MKWWSLSPLHGDCVQTVDMNGNEDGILEMEQVSKSEEVWGNGMHEKKYQDSLYYHNDQLNMNPL